MVLHTRLTDRFDLRHPIFLAPMDPASGGPLAAAVTQGGGLGMIGGGYGDRDWLRKAFAAAKGERVGCGFITWSMAQDTYLLDIALDHDPVALMLSFADPAPFADKIVNAGVPLICQVHTLAHAQRAIDVGASVIVAQGTEAGGHGFSSRSTLPFVPTVADFLKDKGSECLLLAAGGIADGRGLAAALMLGADGVLMGTRFWATQEAEIHDAAKTRVVAADGDNTIRTRVYDIVREKAWPTEYTGRLMINDFISIWHGREEELLGCRADKLVEYDAAHTSGDYDIANVTVGEAIGLIRDLPGAAELTERIGLEAAALLRVAGKFQSESLEPCR